jgi:hypothetical protein
MNTNHNTLALRRHINIRTLTPSELRVVHGGTQLGGHSIASGLGILNFGGGPKPN